MNDTEARLARIRGLAVPCHHNARTIAALASNPGCPRRAVMDAAGVDKPRVAAYVGFPTPFGQSRFAMARGNAFEAQVKANGAAVYVLALREALGGLRINPDVVSAQTILVCPENFSNRPAAASLDVRKQLTVLRRQLSRLARIDDLLDLLPPGLTFDLDPDRDGIPQRKPGDVAEAVRRIEARYTPECLNTCEMCFFCRDEARGTTASLGKATREDLGGIEQIATVLNLARGAATAAPDQAEAAAALRTAARIRTGILGQAV